MPAAFKRRLEKNPGQTFGGGSIDKLLPKGQHIGVIMRAHQPDFFGIRTESRADSVNLVGRDGHADAGATHQHPAIRLARGHLPCHFQRVVGVIGGSSGVRSEIGYFIAGGAQRVAQIVLESKSGMVGRNRDSHGLDLILASVKAFPSYAARGIRFRISSGGLSSGPIFAPSWIWILLAGPGTNGCRPDDGSSAGGLALRSPRRGYENWPEPSGDLELAIGGESHRTGQGEGQGQRHASAAGAGDAEDDRSHFSIRKSKDVSDYQTRAR